MQTLAQQPAAATKPMTQPDIIIAYLRDRGGWLATYELRSVNTPYGFIGSSGDVRARELARNDCADRHMHQVEKALGSSIGLKPGIEYFRYRSPKPVQLALPTN